MNSIRDGQFKLNEFLLIDATAKTVDCGKAEDLTALCVQANIYESVLEPCVRAEFEFYDAKGAGEALIFTNKKIVIDFTTNEDNPKSAIRYEFYVIGEPVRVQSPDDKALIYKVECVTYEAWKSTDIKNAPLVRKKIECEKMVKAYLEILGSQKPLFAEKTRGLHAFNFTVKSPFECIDEIRLEYAMSQEFKGHAFYFFENKHGYVFKSMEMLIKEGKENIGDKCFLQSTLTNLDVTGAKWRNILTTKIIQKGNEGIAKLIGAGAGSVKQFNKVTGDFEDFEADPKNLEFETLNKGSASTTLKAQHEKAKDGNKGHVKEISYDPSISNIERAEKFNHMPYYMAHFLTVIMQITIYGDSTITAGDVIKCQLPEASGLTKGEKNPINEDSAITSGNYMVTKCRHMLTFNEKAEYAQALELVKDGIGGVPQTHTN
jgi:hypothetical protein